MDKNLSRNNKEKVLRRLEGLLQPRGFCRGKSMYFIRISLPYLEFVQLRHTTSDASFRITMGMRVVDDSWNAIGLNDAPYERYHSALGHEQTNLFQYGEDENSVVACARGIVDFIEKVAEPWYNSARNLVLLVPLNPDTFALG
ncbi:hypothetical protein ACO0K3_02820 [Undibacterium sp. Rencai35W]|uniref:hypothetical protein n=1 Tax=Undibacterium sp. Rencai35W TaxID=3413046 RepID=UPI003BEFFD2C